VFQTKVVEKIKTHILCSIFFSPENRDIYEIMWGKTQNVFLRFHCKNGYANAPQCYVIRTPLIWSEFTVTQERHY